MAWSLTHRTEPTAVPVGKAADFTTGSVTEVTLDTGHYDPFGVEGPGDDAASDANRATTRLFIVNDPEHGLLALSDRSPWLGCRVVEV
jgi:hypothetical protein